MSEDMGLIVRTNARALVPFIGIFGAYIVMHGHLTPGGGFQGGATIAGAGILFLVAFGLKAAKEKINKNLYSALEGVGGLVFLGAAMLGLSVAFFYNTLWHNGPLFNGKPGTLLSAGFLPIMNLGVGLKVFTGLVSAVFALSLFRRWKE
ncbi:cation:proton antiporter [Thermococcus chitonophagus]|nr:Na(+)/H(+) antiporter subunit B [Thermococcus chitonophagus]ASJ16946.1 cation:proton antiporter [Thermococcus chitonophagus]